MYDHFYFLIYFNLRGKKKDRKVNVYRSKSLNTSKSVGVAEMYSASFSGVSKNATEFQCLQTFLL